MLVQPCHLDYFAAIHTQCVPLCILQLHHVSSFISSSHAPLPCAISRVGVPENRLNSLLPSMMPFFPSFSKLEEKNCIALHCMWICWVLRKEQVRDLSIVMGYCVHERSGVPYGQAPAAQ